MAIIPSTLNTGLSAEQVMEAFDNALTHVPGTSTPTMDGTGAAGTADTFSRSDHVHPSDTSKQDAISSAAPIASECVSPMTGYSKSSSSTPGAINTSDTLNAAIGKLEKRTDLNETNISTDEAALAELIDTGAKNVLKTYDIASTTSGNVTYSVVNGVCTVSITGTQSSAKVLIYAFDTNVGTQTVDSRNTIAPGTYVLKTTGNGKIKLRAYEHNGTTATLLAETTGSDAEFTYTGDAPYVTFTLSVSSNTALSEPVVFTPLCALKKLYDISDKAVPYCPTLAELYAMIQAQT